MTGFLIAAAILLATGAAALLWPLLRGSTLSPNRRAGAIVALFRDQLRELEAERKSGAIEETQYRQSRHDIEHNLLEEVAGVDAPASGPRRARVSATLIGVFIVVAPMALYATLGTPDALIPGMVSGANDQANARSAARALTSAQVQKVVEGLEAKLKQSPGDADGWAMLARAYAYQRQFPESVRAYTRAVALRPKDAHLLADLADALAMTNGQRLDGEPLKLIERALQIDPREVKALALAGTAAFDHQQYAKAVDYWERALQVAPNDAEFSQNLRNSLDEARRLAGASATSMASSGAPASGTDKPGTAKEPASAPVSGSVRGKVTLAANLAAKAAPGDTVFVFARAAQGPRVPLALVRRQVKDLPFEFALDDSMAMMPDFTVSKYSPVIIGARISRSGDAIAAPGDLQGFSKPVAVGANSVSVTIDQVVR
ncbi:MAG TPA: c-type cytochrome biogenesis protein CcmI [Burkholderiaceae bacterium]|nr:c-type cytochrome biogenesis protein CcmI [Burkholderiaceae bacterium]